LVSHACDSAFLRVAACVSGNPEGGDIAGWITILAGDTDQCVATGAAGPPAVRIKETR
jgi:hypothetical protein